MSRYRFSGGVEFDPASGELRRNGTITRLEPQPAAVLALLAARAGEVVTHDDIRRAIWGDNTHVALQDGVHYCLHQVRAALGDRARDPGFIDTIPRRGYRLRPQAIAAATVPVVPRRSSNWQRRLFVSCAAAALAMTVGFFERRPNNHHQIAVTVLKTVHDVVF
jgi:DNA-binding winged helix-turn-helix (wHTH) protein